MQINLMFHPSAFATLEDAFDPWTNTQYGARFLGTLYREIGSWPQAAAAYHSRTPGLGAKYETRIMAMWPLGGQFSGARLNRGPSPSASEPDTSGYTPELVARTKQIRADAARLAAMSGPTTPTTHQQADPTGPEYNRYTPEFAARLKQTRAESARLAAMSAPIVSQMRQPVSEIAEPDQSAHTSPP